MNEENGKHEFNFFLDKQLQQNLLDANEELLEKEFSLSVVSGLGSNGVQSCSTPSTSTSSTSKAGANQNQNQQNNNNKLHNKFSDCVHVCGWCPDPNTVYRKTETDAPPTRSKGSYGGISRESIYSRDSKSRPQNVVNFVFRHYTDPRRYIEQYRKEHACIDSTNSSAAKTEFLETRRFYAYNQYSPLAVPVGSNPGFQQNSYIPQPQLDPPPAQIQTHSDHCSKHQQPTPSLQYTNRREQKKSTISATLNSSKNHQYKLSKTPPNLNKTSDHVRDYTEEYVEALESMKKHRRPLSAKEKSTSINGFGLQKPSATKINVPSANFAVKGVRTAANSGANQDSGLHGSATGGQRTGPNGSTLRMLDSLMCGVSAGGNAADKQINAGFIIFR